MHLATDNEEALLALSVRLAAQAILLGHLVDLLALVIIELGGEAQVIAAVRHGIIANDLLNVSFGELAPGPVHIHAQAFPGELLLHPDGLSYALPFAAQSTSGPAHLAQQLVANIVLFDLLLHAVFPGPSQDLGTGQSVCVAFLPEVGLHHCLCLP
ncbi:hypothetical protein AALO_G00263960 [Alosa alosa]|uniref:Uncharacterized protein n=1 Tax=Alosa alosa TaxID=278164 RepID=A0AAV6FNK1_9TELE|nr:hypothetical protein AALO_G00263960 [Alosa alosa]